MLSKSTITLIAFGLMTQANASEWEMKNATALQKALKKDIEEAVSGDIEKLNRFFNAFFMYGTRDVPSKQFEHFLTVTPPSGPDGLQTINKRDYRAYVLKPNLAKLDQIFADEYSSQWKEFRIAIATTLEGSHRAFVMKGLLKTLEAAGLPKATTTTPEGQKDSMSE